MSTNLENSESSDNASNGCMDEHNGINDNSVDDVEGDAVSDSDIELSSPGRHGLDSLKEDRQLSVEYLEDECDVVQDVNDLDDSLFIKPNMVDTFCGFSISSNRQCCSLCKDLYLLVKVSRGEFSGKLPLKGCTSGQ